jgi:hypothetical protein
MARDLRLYQAENAAAALHPAKPLDGALPTAQAYCDRITRSAWWQSTCPPSFLGDHRTLAGQRFWRWDTSRPPRRVIIAEGRNGGGHAWTSAVFPHRGRYYPRIMLGHGKVNHDAEAIADPWVILHELGHIMASTDEGTAGHNEMFLRRYIQLVHRWLSPAAAAELRRQIREHGIRTRNVL